MERVSSNYHLAPEIFVSQGTPGSIVEKWVHDRGGIGGIHHLAYQVDSVAEKMKEWQEKGYAEFTTTRTPYMSRTGAGLLPALRTYRCDL
jgi:hypothetical protein